MIEGMQTLKGSTALVTGAGRPRGIGTAICRKLAQEGVNVFYTYWHQYDIDGYPETDNPENLLGELRSLGVRAECHEFDLSQPEAPHKLFRQAAEQLGTPNILINNACFDRAVKFTDHTPDLLDKHYAINLRAVIMLCVAFVKAWNGNSYGRIINMTSGQSLGPMSVDQISYTATKAGLEMLARQLAPYLAERGITINAVDPGPTDTGWMSDALKAKIKRESVVNEPGTVADAIVTLLLGDSNGEVLHVGR
jgi:3-oxoacyl-[acyl-carrier protein] reductase